MRALPALPVARYVPRASSERWTARELTRISWFGLLLVSICFEGLVRKLVPAIPQAALYFLKDIVLVAGLGFGVSSYVKQTALRTYGSFMAPAGLAAAWICLQLFNPEQASILLGLLGIRGYCLWWCAPLVIPSMLDTPRLVRTACTLVAMSAVVVAAMAFYQFNQPADAAINGYAWGAGAEDDAANVAIVTSTGRARVTSTFSYFNGFNHFAVLVAPFLIACGLVSTAGRRRLFYLATGTLLVVCSLMSGSRAAVVYALVTFPLTVGLRPLSSPRLVMPIAAAIVVGTVGALYLAPEAAQGVLDRFAADEEETTGRLVSAFASIPPVGAFFFEYPLGGIGTGMTHNARQAFGVFSSRWPCEIETHRVLVELGLVGYVFASGARAGLAVALVRLRGALERPNSIFSGYMLALALLGLFLPIVVDHIAQALYFTFVGLVISLARRTPPNPGAPA